MLMPAILSPAIAIATFFAFGFLGAFPVFRLTTVNGQSTALDGQSVAQTFILYGGLHVPHLITAGAIAIAVALVATYGLVNLASQVKHARSFRRNKAAVNEALAFVGQRE